LGEVHTNKKAIMEEAELYVYPIRRISLSFSVRTRLDDGKLLSRVGLRLG
ncbi:MAG: hypothetical protein GW761_11595, partial [Leptospira sp.]|nr:hypothetical protein [Leptospira sp.]